MKQGKLLLTGLLATSVLLGGCAVGPTTSTRYYETVRVAPPPPYVEHVGSPPAYGHVWISGYWNWGGARYAWVPGRWEAPRPGYAWVPHRWERDGDHWRQHGGRWEAGGGHQERHAAPQPKNRETPRMQQQEAPRAERRGDFRNERGEHEGRSMPDRNATLRMSPEVRRQPEPQAAPRMVQVSPAQVQAVPRTEPVRMPERNEVRSAPERGRGPDASERGGQRGGRDERGERGERGKERGAERNSRDEAK
jgi:hypothetical protein